MFELRNFISILQLSNLPKGYIIIHLLVYTHAECQVIMLHFQIYVRIILLLLLLKYKLKDAVFFTILIIQYTMYLNSFFSKSIFFSLILYFNI